MTAEPCANIVPPLPDVWIPFNDSLDMITGFSPSYKKIVIGDDEITMPGDKIVKFKRASTATYINKSGQLKLAEVDEPRFERDGLLIEGQRTNYLRNSNKPDSWTVHSALNKTFGTDKQGVQLCHGDTHGKYSGNNRWLYCAWCGCSRQIPAGKW